MDTLFAMLVGLVTFLVIFGVPTLSVLALHFGIVTVVRNVKANGRLRFHGKDRQGIALGIVGVLGLTISGWVRLFVQSIRGGTPEGRND